MQRSLLDQNEPLLHAESFLSDQQCRSLLASAIRPVRHNAPLQLSCRCKAQEPSLIDSWRADSESLSMTPVREYPMCKNVHEPRMRRRNRDGISTRRLNVGVFTRPRPGTDKRTGPIVLERPTLRFRE